MSGRARIDAEVIASLRERSRPRRPEALLTSWSSRSADEQLQPVVDDLFTKLEELEDCLADLGASLSAKEQPVGHTLFVSAATGYAVAERDGPPPAVGADVLVDGRPYRAMGYRRSPFPNDRRPCVIVEAAIRLQ